jgi:hypothetical protein
VLLALATLMKPLGAPYFPLLLVLSLALQGLAATAVGAGAAALTALAVFSPFLATRQGAEVLHRVLGDVRLMAHTSSNAHNLWWALGPWKNSEVPWLGPLTATQVGLGLFGVVYAAGLWKAHRLHRRQPDGIQTAQVLALAGLVGFSFFMFSTHLHENHMFMVIPLLLPLITAGRPWRWLFAAVSLGVFLNLVLHDLTIPVHWPFTLGGPSGVTNLHLKRPFFVAEIAAIQASTIFNLAVFAAFLWGIFRPGGRGLLEGLCQPSRREVRKAESD